MKKPFFLSLILLLSINYCTAQFECGLTPEMEEGLNNPPPPPLDHCFEIDEVQDNCTPVYVKVNMHFFLDDNCDGPVAAAPGVQGDLSAENAFLLADEMVNTANSFLEEMSLNAQWNQAEHGAVETDVQCVPIRYLLKGVYLHCDEDAQEVDVELDEVMAYYVNQTSEINIFVSNIPQQPGGSNPNGFGFNFANVLVIENFDPRVFSHEMGQVFSLGHPFDFLGDGCNDTWKFDWTWDSDCDGTNEASGNNCWYSENIYNGLDACDENNFCSVHPCCEWSSQNNNLMVYSAWAGNPDLSALTPCQVTKMLIDISDNMCDFVECVGCICPPPSAFIGTIPTLSQTEECPTCFYLSASFNETLYDITVTDEFGNTLVNTGHIYGEANKYCIKPTYGGNWPLGFTTGNEYTVSLTVQNDCGATDSHEITFTLPPPCEIIGQEDPQPPKIDVDGIAPNPGTDLVTVTVNVHEPGNLRVYGAHPGSMTSYGQLLDQPFQVGDNQQLPLDISNWTMGTNSVIFEFEGEIIVENLVKQ